MNMKRRISMLLAGVMMVGTIGTLGTIPASAAGETNTFTLTVPADTNITAVGWNDIGNVGVSNVSIEDGKKIEVTIDGGATGRTLKKTGNASKTVGYEVKIGNATTNAAFGDKLEFTANGTQAIGADVNATQFAAAEAGTYEDTINFKAELAGAVVTYARTGKAPLSSANLGTPTSWIYGGTTYQVYNAFIPSSSGSSWNDAMGFVAALNTAKFDGHEDWTLLSSESMATAYAASGTGAMPESSARGAVTQLWSSVDCDSETAYTRYCDNDRWRNENKSYAEAYRGFVVLRGSSN